MTVPSNHPGLLNRAGMVLGVVVALIPFLFVAAQWCMLQDLAHRALSSGNIGFFHNGPVAPEVWLISLDPSLQPSSKPEGYVGVLSADLLEHVRSEAHRLEPGEMSSYVRGDECFFFTPEKSANPSETDYKPAGVLVADASVAWALARFSGGVIAFLCFGVDVLLWMGVRYMKSQLQRAELAKRDFFANASHELKTPLMVIGAHIDAVRAQHESFDDAAAGIDRELARSERLVGDILLLSKADAGMVDVSIASFDVRETLFDVVRSLGPEARSRGIELSPVNPTPLVLGSDEDKVATILFNAAVNALRHAASVVRVGMTVQEEQIELFVENDGAALGNQEREHLFDRFYSCDAGGTGIGMALAADYADRLGAKLTADSSKGGTRVSLWLPRTWASEHLRAP